jgi:hypothetical protein
MNSVCSRLGCSRPPFTSELAPLPVHHIWRCLSPVTVGHSGVVNRFLKTHGLPDLIALP